MNPEDEYLEHAIDALDRVWEILTASNPACSCCSGDAEYVSRVIEVGEVIGRTLTNDDRDRLL